MSFALVVMVSLCFRWVIVGCVVCLGGVRVCFVFGLVVCIVWFWWRCMISLGFAILVVGVVVILRLCCDLFFGIVWVSGFGVWWVWFVGSCVLAYWL